MLITTSQRYIQLFKVETVRATVVYAVCVEVTGPGEYSLSEPRIVKVINKSARALPGKTVSFALPGISAPAVHHEHIPSPYISECISNKPVKLNWYLGRAPNVK